MKKTGLISVLAATCMLSTSIGAYASTDVQFKPVVKLDGTYFSVEGTTPNGGAGKFVNIFIVNPNKTMTSDSGAFNSVATVKTGEDGGFKYEAPVYMDGVEDTGDYTLYLSGTDYASVYKCPDTLFLASEKDQENAVLMLKNSDATNIHKNLTEIISPNVVSVERALSLSNEIYDAVSKSELEALIVENKAYLDENNVSGSVFLIKKLSLIEAINEGKTEFMVSKDGTELNSDIIKLSSIDKNGVTLYDVVYKNATTQTAKEGILEYIKGKNSKNEEEFLKEFEKACMIYGMNNPLTGGGEYFETLLTTENAEKTGVDLGEYNSITQNERNVANSLLSEMTFTSIKDISDNISDAVKEATKEDEEEEDTRPSKKPGSVTLSGTPTPSTPVVAPTPVEIFSDIADYTWAKESIEALYNAGVVTGVGDNKFNPQGNIKREDLIVMLARALKLQSVGNTECFSDCVEGSYYHNALNSLKTLGIVNGVGNNEFGVGKNVTRQDLCTMLYNALKTLGKVADTDGDITFDDKDEISEYAKNAVKYFSNKGVVSGFSDNTFSPTQFCTRAQAAKIIYGVLKEVK